MSFIQELLTGINNILQPQQSWLSEFFSPQITRLQDRPLELGTVTTERSSYFKAIEEALLSMCNFIYLSMWNFKRWCHYLETYSPIIINFWGNHSVVEQDSTWSVIVMMLIRNKFYSIYCVLGIDLRNWYLFRRFLWVVQLLSRVQHFATPWSTPGFPVVQYLPEFAQTHVHWVIGAIPTISSSVTQFSSCPQSFPALGSFPTSCLFTSSSQSIVASASASVLPVNIQG